MEIRDKNVIVQSFNEGHIDGIVKLWNSSISNGFVYKPFTAEGFINKFVKNPYFFSKSTLVMIMNGEIVGFISASFSRNVENEVYLTMILIRSDMRRKGYGGMFLKYLEEDIKLNDKSKIRMDFLNPINLEWLIPETKKRDHPNAPGIDVEAEAYSFFKNHGYIERTKVISMYMSLDKFSLDNSIKAKVEILKKYGIEIKLYNKERNYSFDYLFYGLKNEMWKREIENNLSLKYPCPIIVAVKDEKICGFAGPLQIEKSGRGLFSGIGVHPDFQNMGIGKALFFMLCNNFKSIGASFMSLFTGINNNAMKIYEDAGFEVKKTWALLIKEI